MDSLTHLIVHHSGAAGNFLCNLFRDYCPEDTSDLETASELNEYRVSIGSHDKIRRAHPYDLIGIPDPAPIVGKSEQVEYIGKNITWIVVEDVELSARLLLLADIKHGETPDTKSLFRWRTAALRWRQYYKEKLAYVASRNDNVMKLDYKRFFIDVDEALIREWCDFVGIEFHNTIISAILDYTAKNRKLLEQYNVYI